MIKRMQGLLLVLSLSLFAVHAQAVTLCAPPLKSGCIKPNWGEILPESSTPGGGNNARREGSGPSVAIASGLLRPVADKDRPEGWAPSPRLYISDGRVYERETSAVIRAVARAQFDKEGRLVEGRERIEEAVAALKKAAPDHQLSLYIRTPRDLKPEAKTVVVQRLVEVQRVLDGKAPPARS